MSANGKRKPSFLSQDEEEEEDSGGGGGAEGDHAGSLQSPIDSLGKDLVDDDDFPIDLKVGEALETILSKLDSLDYDY